MRSPRILFITGEYPPLRGGISDYVYLLRRELCRQRMRTFVLSSSGASGRGVSTVSDWSWRLPGIVRRMVDELGIDIVHLQYQAGAFRMRPAVNLLPLLCRGMPRVKTAVTFHDLRPPYLFPKAGRLRSTTIRSMARFADAVIVTNPADGQELICNGVQPVRIPLGPSLPPRERPTSTRDNSVAFFGFPSREKGIYSLIEALSLIAEERRPDLRIVGGSRPSTGAHHFEEAQAIHREATKAGVELDFTGYLPPELASNELSRCRAIAFPFPEGASLRSSALIAALNLGAPVVTTVARGQDQLNGLARLSQLTVVPAGDARLFAEALDRNRLDLVTPDPLPAQFSWRSIAHRHRCLYQSVAGGLA